MERPVVVSVISWYLIISTLLSSANSILNIFLGFYDGRELLYIIVINIIVLLTTLPAILMLNGKNIGRILYVFLMIFSFGSSIYNSGSSTYFLLGLIAPFVLFIVFVILLYQPKVNDYFSASSVSKVKDNKSAEN